MPDLHINTKLCNAEYLRHMIYMGIWLPELCSFDLRIEDFDGHLESPFLTGSINGTTVVIHPDDMTYKFYKNRLR